MPDFTPDINEAGVRKWRKRRFGISDYGDAAITLPASNDELFHTDGLPVIWPTGVKDLGYITTDGTTSSLSVSASGTQMLQSLRPVRSDLDSIEETIAVAFGESNAWVKALRRLLPVSDWPTDRDEAWGFDGADITDVPYFTLWMQSQDGVGTQAVYRSEVIFKARPTALADSVMNASASEDSGFTFGIFLDEATSMTGLVGQDGPLYTTHIGTIA